MQPTAKPIYKRNRVVLGSDETDESEENFINANLIHRRIIVSQCPLTSLSGGYENTIKDVKRMIIERRISYWISLAPYLPKEKNMIFENQDRGLLCSLSGGEMKSRCCALFPLQYHVFDQSENFSSRYFGRINRTEIENSGDKYLDGISDFKVEDMLSMPLPYINMSYTVSAYFQKGFKNNDYPKILFEGEFSNAVYEKVEWEYRSQKVSHIWYYNWKDFITPPMEDFPALQNIIDESVEVIGRKMESMALITCFSGRGRSGTLSALLVSKLERVKTMDELVNVIVSMRENRDGLVETPEQFEFIVNMLGLNKSSVKSASRISFPLYTMDLIVSSCLLSVIVVAVCLGSIVKYQRVET